MEFVNTMSRSSMTTTTRATIPAVRTPEHHFSKLQDAFPYEPKYLENMIGGLRMAYYEAPFQGDCQPSKINQASGGGDRLPVFVCLHGEPSWSFLYRHMVPIFQKKGTVICFDLLGFGRSDKPTRRNDYSYSLHRTSLLEAIHNRLNLRNVTLVVQDWGGILGLSLPIEDPTRYSRLLIMNTLLPIEPETHEVAIDVKVINDSMDDVSAGTRRRRPKSGFGRWLSHSQSSADMDVGRIVRGGCQPQRLSNEEVEAYNAPFPTEDHKVGAIVFPTLVPIAPNMEGYAIGRQALFFYQHFWNKPTFFAVGSKDGVIPLQSMHRLASYFKNPFPELVERFWIVSDGGHFVQEHHGSKIATKALEYFDSLPAPVQQPPRCQYSKL